MEKFYSKLEKKQAKQIEALKNELKQVKVQTKKEMSDIIKQHKKEMDENLKLYKKNLREVDEYYKDKIYKLEDEHDELNKEYGVLEEKYESLTAEYNVIKPVYDRVVKESNDRKSIIKLLEKAQDELVSKTDKEWANSDEVLYPEEPVDLGEYESEWKDICTENMRAINEGKLRAKTRVLYDAYLCPEVNPKTGELLSFESTKLIREWYLNNIDDYEKILENNKALTHYIITEGMILREEDKLAAVCKGLLDKFLESFESIEVCGY